MNDSNLTGRVALVTGAGQGIGRAIAARLLGEGAKVALWELDGDAGRDAADELAGDGAVLLEELDIGDRGAVVAAMRRTVDWGGALDIVVNNAASTRTFGTPLEELALDDFDAVLRTNLSAPLHIVQCALPQLRMRCGVVINIASTRAFMSEPDTFAYSASKGGLVSLTHSLALSLGSEVRVNAIAPGWIATDAWRPRASRRTPELSEADHRQHPAGRVGRPEDIASLVAYLASGAAGFITGQVFTVDGGMTRKMIYAE